MAQNPKRGNTVVIVVLTVLIVLMIAVTALLIYLSIDLVKNAGAETQQWWNHAGTYESQIANCGLLGDYAADRQTVEVTSCDFTIVTFNEADFKGRIVADANSVKTGIGAETVSAAITMSGCPAAWTAILTPSPTTI